MRKRLMVLILVLGVLFAPSIAFADDFLGYDDGDFYDKIVYGPSAVDVLAQRFGVQVYSGNKFNAALCALGYDPYNKNFTSDVKAYLSNASTGGAFYDFADLFQHDLTYFGVDPLGVIWSSALVLNNGLYGKDSVWCSVYDETIYDSAKHRVEQVLDGNVGGGGSDLPDINEGYDYLPVVGSNSGDIYTLDKYKSDQKYNSVNIDVKNFRTWFSGKNNICFITSDNGSGALNKYMIVSLSDGLYPVVGKTNGKLYVYNSTDETKSYYVRYYDWSITANSDGNYEPAGGGNNNQLTIGAGRYNLPDDKSHIVGYVYNTVGNNDPVVPPTQWPEPDPVTPTEPPAVPDPPSSDPVSDPTNVNIGIPQLPNIGLTIEPTYGTADLSAILDAMAKHCQHLQTCMIDSFDTYYSSITQFEKSLQENTKEFLRSWFRVTLDTIRDCFDDLSDYLQRLFTWLADQMDFTFTGGDFDDSSIVWWLKQIYSKLGSGTTIRPTDPVVDPTGIGDWFDQLIKNFIAALLGLGQEALSDVGDMVEDLTHKFPFSIPWDIAALLALFVATPQTPVLEIPQYALTGNGVSQVGMYTIDLMPYDGVMEIARSIEKVVFAFWLAWKIDFFKAIFNGIVGGDK